ncbi:MAG: two-component system, cell cycle sensor histidine kinase PleC [Saliniramus fredricksonii]|uniref:histidine kinase n=1 Tax=Saliniramus fredricksonii TaxID=1653334 RepID=A0A0P7X4L5_9HYPH|nr:HAMP domain-containing sensor histidine kinase [Saliniramus fredricksonii]KPQ09716.1 MAG: two-component system, cell cycle sensor histidine kinase PleC [Saliniramus fredricksonii]SCC79865.1 two-component system, cell cycle sensor histidine kinase PleC [Saliniramus fredricksonii]
MSRETVTATPPETAPFDGDAQRRRKAAHNMRAARERLTSAVGLERSFELEFLRLFAQYRTGAAIPLFVLAAAGGAVASFWLPLETAGLLFGVIALTIGLMVMLSRRLLRQGEDDTRLGYWHRVFVIGEALQGASWALLVQALANAPAPGSDSFVLFVTLMASAVTAMLSATLPAAVYAGLLPLSVVVLAHAMSVRNVDAAMMAAMTISAQIFFVFLARRLYSSALATLRSRAEKDKLFFELEEAKANSDEARRRAEEANLAKSRFLATMSHELRTPLNAILGFSEVMKDEVFGEHSNRTYKDYSADIHSSGQHLLNLINEILDLSRIEAGRYELNEEALLLSYMIDDCRHMMNLRSRAKEQTIKAMIDPTLPRIWADERAMRQIILNILSNAVKFTPPGGEIVIKAGWTSSGGQYVSIRDNGPGIPAEEIPIIMSSFGRGTWALKTAEQGSGLGLPIVKGLVEMHGGHFQLTSAPREGTEVIMTLPASRVMNALPAMDVAESEDADGAAHNSRTRRSGGAHAAA